MSKDKILFALDVASADEAWELVEELSDEVGGFKIGLQLFSAEGPQLVRDIVSKGNRVFLDVKFHDIPNTVAAASVEIAKLGIWMFNVHVSGGIAMMEETRRRVASYCQESGISRPRIIGVTVLTSLGDDDLNAVGFSGGTSKTAVRLAKLAFEAGLDGVVAAGKDVQSIKEQTSSDFLVVTPGVRPSFATTDDQRRVVTPKDAILVGSDFLVLGRAIKNSEDRVKAARAVAGEISSL